MGSGNRREGRTFVGVADHAGWAVLVTATNHGEVVDRRRIELVAPALPKLPHHHEAQSLPMDQALALIETVRRSAEQHAREALASLAGDVPSKILGISLRTRPPLPESVAERITSYRAQCVADTVMYRQALADAAAARGWSVRWYDVKQVPTEAARALGRDTIEDLLRETGRRLGPPWQKDHRTAMAAAIAAADRTA